MNIAENFAGSLPKRYRARYIALLLPAAMVLAILTPGCREGDEGPEASAQQQQVLGGGTMIRVSDRSIRSGIFRTVSLQPGMIQAEVIAPARVAAGASAALAGEERPIILFDSPDMASLYSTFTQSAAAYDKARKDLARTRDLFDHQAATGKDVAEAEATVTTAQAALGEAEAKIRALGFNPEELGGTRSGTVWLISDVPESQLFEVQRGERTSIELPSFPGETFYGRVEAIGDVVDNATRTVKVRIAVPNPGGRIKPGMYAQADFGQSQTSVMAVPEGAVITVLGRHYAFVESGPGQFERREVELGKQVGDSIIVSGGIRRGESVVVEGAMLLKGLSFGY